MRSESKGCQIVPPMAKSSRRNLVRDEQVEETQILYTCPSSPHGFLPVCGCRTAIFTVGLFFFSLLFTFAEASRSITDSSPSYSPTNPPTSPLKTHHIHVDPNIVTLLIIFSALLTSLIVIMALFKCFGFKSKRKQNRVGNSSTAMEIFTSRETVEDNENKSGNCVRKFSWDEIERLTNNFSKVIGSGGYSTVYLAQSPDSGHGFWAIKIHNGSERLSRVFKQELDILLRLGHESIVKVVGYCDDRGECISL